MIRIQIGTTWKTDPELLLALRGTSDTIARAVVVHQIVDAVAVEVDGVDIGAGQTEGPVLDAMEALVEALARLCSLGGSVSVSFQDGLVDLVLRRQGSSALLSVVRLASPARALAREVEVELQLLVTATQEAVAQLCRDLEDLELPLQAARARSALRTASRLHVEPDRRTMRGPASSALHHEARRENRPPFCTFELRDDGDLLQTYAGAEPDLGSLLVPGHITIRVAEESDALSVPGIPFLLMRDLAEIAGRIMAADREGMRRFAATLARPGRNATLALSLSLVKKEFSVDGGPTTICDPLLLARAFLEVAVDFCAAVVAHNPAQVQNGYLAELSSSAASRLALLREHLAGEIVTSALVGVHLGQPETPPREPLGPGRLKRLKFDQLWQVDVGPIAGTGIAYTGGLVVACGSFGVFGLAPSSGEIRWRRTGAEWSAMTDDSVILSSKGELTCLDSKNGATRWARSFEGGPVAAPYEVVLLGSGSLLVSLPGALLAIDPADGHLLWSFEPPAAGRMRVGAAGEISIAVADNGFLYGIDARGRPVWRLRSRGQLVAPLVVWNRSCLALFSTDRGGSLLALDPATGNRAWETPLDSTPDGTPVTVEDRVVVAGMVGGDPVVTAIDADGRTVWSSAPTVGSGPLAVSPFLQGLIVKSGGGACAAIDPAGEIIWAQPRESTHPPPGNLPARVLRGIVLVSSEQIVALDLSTGAHLGTLPMTAPVRLIIGDDLAVCSADAEGVVAASRVGTHLSVV